MPGPQTTPPPPTPPNTPSSSCGSPCFLLRPSVILLVTFLLKRGGTIFSRVPSCQSEFWENFVSLGAIPHPGEFTDDIKYCKKEGAINFPLRTSFQRVFPE